MLAKLEEIRVRLPWLERLDLVNRPAPMAPELKRDVSVTLRRDEHTYAFPVPD